MPLLARFDGGLNIRRAPHLIAPNEAIECVNVDLSAGTIKSVKGAVSASIPVTGTPTFFEGNSEWYSNAEALEFFEHQRKLYWTADTGAKEYVGGTAAPNPIGTAKPVLPLQIANNFTDPTVDYDFDNNIKYSFVAVFTPDAGQTLDKAIFKLTHVTHGDMDLLTVSGVTGYSFSRAVVKYYYNSTVGVDGVITAALDSYSATNPATPGYMIPHGASYTTGLYIADSSAKTIQRPQPYQATFTKPTNAADVSDVAAAGAAVTAANSDIDIKVAAARVLVTEVKALSSRLATAAARVSNAVSTVDSSSDSQTTARVYSNTCIRYNSSVQINADLALSVENSRVGVYLQSVMGSLEVALGSARQLFAFVKTIDTTDSGYAASFGTEVRKLEEAINVTSPYYYLLVPAGVHTPAAYTGALDTVYTQLNIAFTTYSSAVSALATANSAFAAIGIQYDAGEVAAGITQEIPRITIRKAGYVRLYLNTAGILYLLTEVDAPATWTYVFWNMSFLTAGAALTINYVQYVYSYYESTTLSESNESPLSLAVPVEVGVPVELTDIATSTDPFVTHVRLYRVGLGSTTFSRIVELANGTNTYSDSLPATATALPVAGDPPDRLLRYLTFASGLFFGSVENRLYFTDDIQTWVASDVLYFNHTITGTSRTLSGLLVFSEFETYLLTGSSASTFVSYEISGDQGCISNASIVSYANQLIWLSSDGVCSTTGGNVKVLSKFKLGKQTFDVVNAVVHDETYYAQLVDGRILAFDFRYEPSIKYYSFNTSYLVSALDQLYGKIGSVLFTLFTGDATHYSYKTGWLDDGVITAAKEYNTILVYSTGVHVFEVLIDGTQVLTYTITEDGVTDLAVPQDLRRGRYIQFKMSGVGEISAIEYSFQWRKNV